MSTIYLTLAELIRNNKPVVLLTVIDGPNIGATLLATPNLKNIGTLGDPELDRVAVRDALGELEAGRTSVRNYGPSGQVTPEDLQDTPTVRVFVESFSPPPQ
ncbi:MAG: sulfurylase large subunit, partial [Actinobacteria bacterium]|nr:sulfurylase large subunit [Actinomycetota bacterium]